MPITLKIKNPKASSPQNAVTAAPSPPPPSKRAKIEADPVIPLHPAPAPAQPSVPTPPPRKRARTRSPTPPSHQVTHCLPIPTKKKSLPTTITSDDITQALELLVLRYAKLAGYDAVQSGVLDVLRRWLACYLLELGQMSEELALLGGRAWPNGRDLVEAIRFQGLFSRKEEQQEDDGEDDAEKEPAVPMDVSHLIAWRHTVPDYHDEYLNREKHSNPSSPSSSRAATPAWAENRQVALVEPSGGSSQDEPATTAAGDDDDTPLTLLSSKKRIKEKIARSEIPDHLPDLPALHTWKKTDAYPTNKMLAAQESQAASTNSTSHTWARLDARLTSSRRVQGSLRSLIGRLDGVYAMGISGRDAGVAQNEATPSVYTPSPRSGTVDLPPDASQRSRRSISRAQSRDPTNVGLALDTSHGIDHSAASSPTTSRPRSGRLSLRLRTQTHAGHSNSTDTQPPLGSPLQSPAAAGLGDAPGSLSHRRSQSLRTLGGADGFSYFSVASPSHSHSRKNSMSSSSFQFQQPWMNPLMSPVTPRTATATTPAWPFSPAATGYMDSPGGGHGSVMSTDQHVPIALPPVVNFKSGWYGRKA